MAASVPYVRKAWMNKLVILLQFKRIVEWRCMVWQLMSITDINTWLSPCKLKWLMLHFQMALDHSVTPFFFHWLASSSSNKAPTLLLIYSSSRTLTSINRTVWCILMELIEPVNSAVISFIFDFPQIAFPTWKILTITLSQFHLLFC